VGALTPQVSGTFFASNRKFVGGGYVRSIDLPSGAKALYSDGYEARPYGLSPHALVGDLISSTSA
jgi:hypothetical protein